MDAILPAILSCHGTTLTDEEKRFFSKANPLGINLFARNISSKTQLKNLIKECRETIGRDDLIIAIDQEGGRVRRLVEPEYRSYAAAITLGALPPHEAEEACRLHSRLIAADLRELGINVNYAPVLDTLYPETSPALISRCFSSDTKTIIRLGKTCVDEYISCGICPCIKHMPGHGRTHADPHLNLPRLDTPLDELAPDFSPFRQLNYSPLGMTAHVVVAAVDDTAPVTQSKKAIDTIIRGLIGFDGLLISDAIDMKALSGSSGEKALRSLEAGCDCICYTLGQLDEMQDIADNCHPMTDYALERWQKAKKVWNKKVLFANSDKTAQNYQQLIGKIPPYQETYDATEVLNKLLNKEKK
ncbi:MAG: glycoside hydrolase family 3 protein [Alphaproteobacteria bacterium]|nr:glycoside hydrolase family 3 protein [Alphaproteobacteria bacterium]